jgi:hypothetical protein
MATAFTPTVFAPQGRADYRINPVAGVEYKPQDGMTQLNQILDYQGKQLDLTQKQELLQPKIEAGKAESKKLQLEAQKAGVDLNQHFENIKRSVYGGFLNDPDFINGNKEAMRKKIEASNEYLKSIGVPEMHEGKSHDAFLQLIDTEPTQAYQAIKNGVQQAGGAQNQYQNLQGYQNAPIQNQPQNQPSGQSQGQVQPVAETNIPDYSKPVKLLYPPRQAGIAYAPGPSEIADKDAGVAIRNNLATGASNITTARNNLDEVIKQADKIESEAKYLPETGAFGSVKRKFAELTGDAKYQMLSKDLANVQLANMKALGTLGTNDGLEAQKAATGSITYAPEVIKSIAERTKADLTNVEMQSRAAQVFSNKFGDNNMKAFQQEWANNADTKVFQVINISKNSHLSDKEKQEQVNEILGKDPEARRIFNEKYQNIRKLEQNGKL